MKNLCIFHIGICFIWINIEDVSSENFIKRYEKVSRNEIYAAGKLSSYKLWVLESRFNKNFNQGNSSKLKNEIDYNFDSWNTWRESDGILCNFKEDCIWIDTNMTCFQSSFHFSPNVRKCYPHVRSRHKLESSRNLSRDCVKYDKYCAFFLNSLIQM